MFFLGLIFKDIHSPFVKCRKTLVHIFLLEDELNPLGISSLSQHLGKALGSSPNFQRTVDAIMADDIASSDNGATVTTFIKMFTVIGITKQKHSHQKNVIYLQQ